MTRDIFAQILQMSLIGCYSIGVVLLVRPLLARCGRRYAYYLWLIVFLNLCMPISLKGIFSLIPRQVAEFSLESQFDRGEGDMVFSLPLQLEEQKLSEEVAEQRIPPTEDREPVKRQQADNFQGRYAEILQSIWLLGVLLLLVWNLTEAFALNRRLSHTTWASADEKNQVVEIAGLPTPFLWGIIHPVIYLPAGLKGEERKYVLLHERCHQKRLDYLIQPLLLLVTILHWFNPLVWLAYNLCHKDMEMSCDEAVLAHFEKQVRKTYARSILKYAAKQNRYVINPLTFGEPSVKSRIQHVLQYKKKHMFYSVLAIISIGILSIGLLIRPLHAAEIPITSEAREGEIEEDKLTEENAWERDQIVGVPCKPEESGWNLEEVIILSDGEKLRSYFTTSYNEEADHTKETYLLGWTEHFMLYGSGDQETMLLERNGFYAQIHYPYISDYIMPLILLERDFDHDGIEELAIFLNIKHTDGKWVDTLLMADLETGSGWFVTQLMEDEITESLTQYLSYKRTEDGLQAYVKKEKAGSPLEDREGLAPWQEVRVGERIRISDGEDGSLCLKAELGFYDSEGSTSAAYPGTCMTAEIVWNKGFRLRNITWEKP